MPPVLTINTIIGILALGVNERETLELLMKTGEQCVACLFECRFATCHPPPPESRSAKVGEDDKIHRFSNDDRQQAVPISVFFGIPEL